MHLIHDLSIGPCSSADPASLVLDPCSGGTDRTEIATGKTVKTGVQTRHGCVGCAVDVPLNIFKDIGEC